MTPKRRNKHMVRQAKHYQAESGDIEWPEIPPEQKRDFGDDDGKPVFDQRRHDPTDGLQTAVKTNQGT